MIRYLVLVAATVAMAAGFHSFADRLLALDVARLPSEELKAGELVANNGSGEGVGNGLTIGKHPRDRDRKV